MSHPALDYATHTYLAVTLAPSSPYLSNPASISTLHPGLTHVGQVGELPDVQIFGIPKEEWARANGDITTALLAKHNEGVLRVDVQAPKGRAKRDEL
ncbi:hypothetical protein DENSPDRAFT_257622 [Dentipellis sp. KUC8613]|nr:hypothetical protein DENSPDRAFT_257622 [Dentipellis sp. KUC8613]